MARENDLRQAVEQSLLPIYYQPIVDLATGSQLRRLRTLGCEYGQGFLFSEPLSCEETQALLTSWSPGGVAAQGDRVSRA